MKPTTLIKRLDSSIKEMQNLRNDIYREFEQPDCNDNYLNSNDTIFVGGINWARFNLGATLNNPNGELYSAPINRNIIPKGYKIPTDNDWKDFIMRTTSKWVNLDGVYGRLFTDKYTNASLFLPAISNQCKVGEYSSAREIEFNAAYEMQFNNGYGITFNRESVNLMHNRSLFALVRCIQK